MHPSPPSISPSPPPHIASPHLPFFPRIPCYPPVKPKAQTAKHPLGITTMSDDNEPQGPSINPFIRFKNHVNARIGTGVSVFARTTDDRDKPVDYHGPAHTASSSPWPNRHQSPGSTSELNFWDDWCHVDPYSPHNLQHLPQPTPKDLPSGVDPADFGYPEAFEDLMTASNPFRGHLMDLGMRAGLKRSAEGKLVQPETPSDWVRRLYGDALLPPPFIWEQPRLAGVIPRPWAARGDQPAGGQPHVWGPFETGRRAQHGDDDIDDVARAYLEIMRQIHGGSVESFSKFEEVVGRDVADIIRKGQRVAEKAIEVFSGERPENHNTDNSDVKTYGGAKPASASEEDQPDTEEDLFEMIESASAEADKFFSNFGFGKTRARQAPPPAERTARDTPPTKETVEHDPSGGKTIRTSSEHVDIFGFIHSRTEVRRLNAKGETVDYDTRYSVRSSDNSSRGDHARQEEYRPRSDAPVSVLMTPDQYTAFIGKSSDEQLEAFRLSTAEADGAVLDPQNLALKNRQMQLILQEQQRRTRQRMAQEAREQASAMNSGGAPRGGENHALQDYQMQLMLLEEQNKRRLRAARAAQDGPAGMDPQDYEAALKDLEEQGKERVRRAREEETEAISAPEQSQENVRSERSGWFWR